MKKIFYFLPLLFIFASLSFAYDAGIRKYKLGAVEFIAVKDNDTNLGKAILLNPDAPVVKSVMFDGQNPSSINTFVVKTKDKNVLIDAGIGTGGELLANLLSVGISPDDIDIVIITHMHGDHVGGLLVAGGQRNFRFAQIYIAEPELNYWLTAIQEKNLAKLIQAVYGEDLKTFEFNANITPEIKALDAVGHTPGHTVYEISSGNDKILVIGDMVHNIKVQAADPSMAVVFDIDPKQAVKTRARIFKEAAKNKTKIAGMHIPFPGVGYLSESGAGKYNFDPSYK